MSLKSLLTLIELYFSNPESDLDDNSDKVYGG